MLEDTFISNIEIKFKNILTIWNDLIFYFSEKNTRKIRRNVGDGGWCKLWGKVTGVVMDPLPSPNLVCNETSENWSSFTPNCARSACDWPPPSWEPQVPPSPESHQTGMSLKGEAIQNPGTGFVQRLFHFHKSFSRQFSLLWYGCKDGINWLCRTWV